MEGWFPRHPKGSAAIEALAEGLERECVELDRLARATTQPEWDDGSQGSDRRLVRRHTDRIMSRVQELAESIQTYGDAVADYDAHVDRLNARWAAEHDRDFGVPPLTVTDDATPALVAAADQDHADQVWRARSDVAQSLTAEYERARADLVAAGVAFDRVTRHEP